MNDRLHRTRMLIGEKKLQKLNLSHVLVFGCGAVGSFVIESLARLGVGRISVIDFDKVEQSNINRQLFATSTTIGQKKTDVALKRIKDISSDIVVSAYGEKVDKDNVNTFLNDVDLVIDAIDDVDGKIAIIKACYEKRIPLISSMGAALKTKPECIKVDLMKKTTVCPLASKLRQQLRRENIPLDFYAVYSTEPAIKTGIQNGQIGSVITITGIFGLTIAHQAVSLLTND